MEYRERLEVRDDLVAELYRVYLDAGIVLSQIQLAEAVEYRLKQRTCQSTVGKILKRRGFDTGLQRSGKPLPQIHGKEKVRSVIVDYANRRLSLAEARRALSCSATAIRHHMRAMGLSRSKT